tara:strand:+ start:151 stop:552 length:402 start_codon:yes stop_codon:yes gene_type:complete
MNDNWANEKLSFRDSAIEQRCFKNEFKFRKNSQHPTQKFYKEVNEIIKQIPKEATVFTSQHILPHIIKTRSTVTGTFHEYYDRDYVIIDKTDVFNTKEFIIEEELQATRYKLLFEKENKLFVFKKIITKKIGT